MELRVDALGGHGLQPGLHGPPGCDAVGVPHADEGGRIVGAVLAQAGVLHDDSAGPGQIVPAKGRRAVGAQPRRHPGPRRAAPQGVATGVHLQFLSVVEDKGDGPGQILAGSLGSRAVDQGKSVIALLGQLQGVWKTVVHGPYIGEGPAGIAHSKPRPRFPFEKEQAGVLLVRVGGLLLVGIDVVENGLSSQRPLLQGVDDLHGLAGVNVAVKGQPQISQGLAAPVAVIRGKQQAAIVSEGGIVHHRLDGGIDCKCCLHCGRSFRPLTARHGRLSSAPG